MNLLLNVFTSRLREYCGKHPLEEKVLIAPSRRVGFQWLDAVARSGQPVFNARTATLWRIALDLAGPAIEEKGLDVARGLRLEVLVAGIVSRLSRDASSGERGEAYLAGLKPSPGMIRAVASAIRELRMAGVAAGGLDPGDFEVGRKGVEIRDMLETYEKALSSERLADQAAVFRMALDAIRENRYPAPGVRLLTAADAERDLRGLERALWEAVPGDARVVLPVDEPCEQARNATGVPEPMTDAMLLRWCLEPSGAPGPAFDGTARVKGAVGEANEVREVFRSCVERGIPLDEVEVIYTDTDTYVSHLYELAVRVMPEGSDELPVSFSEGIPAGYSRPGRALSAWLAWIRDGYPQQGIVRMIHDGLLRLSRRDEPGLSFARLGAIMRAVPVGAGLDRYAGCLARAVDAQRLKLERPGFPGEDNKEDPGDADARKEHAAARLEGLGLLQDLMASLVEHTPAPDESGPAVLEHAAYFLENLARKVSKLDSYGCEALLERVEELAECLGEGEGSPGFDVRDWLADLPSATRVLGQGPAPGRLYASNARRGGHSGRPHTFVLGMDDTRFPGAGLQDALLLDAERAAISSDLPTAGVRLDLKVEGFARLMARLRGEVTLSYCLRGLADDREMFPSGILISASSILGGEPVRLPRLTEPPASFAPADAGRCVDMNEWWLWRICSAGPIKTPRDTIGENFSNLARGFRALASRESNRFTEYDGYVPEAGPDCDYASPGGPPVSPSRLETLARCPMEYFFRYVLEVEPPDEYRVDPDKWLDALEQGSLLHAVFCDFMRDLAAGGMIPPDFERDRPALMSILDRYVEDMRVEKPPPPNPDVFAAGRKFLRDTADTFLDMEETCYRDHAPVACELAIGVEPERGGTELDVAGPIDVGLPDGRVVRVRCKLDRVDRVAGKENAFAARDYKTGASEGFRDNGPFHGGRFMQATLYPVLAELVLREKYGLDAEVIWFEYMFPNPWERTRQGWPAEELKEGLELVGLLCDLVASGCFPFTTDAGDLRYSDYVPAFGDITAAASSIERKLGNEENAMLAPFRLLRSGERDEAFGGEVPYE